jgi:hypothetical protein
MPLSDGYEIVDMELFNPHSPRVQFGAACVHVVSELYGITNAKQWAAHPAYARKAAKLAELFDKGVPTTDIKAIASGKKPWP